MGHNLRREVGCPFPGNYLIILVETAEAAPKEFPSSMVHDLVLALVFLAMIIAPALLAMRPESE
jgi:hypothetical protein